MANTRSKSRGSKKSTEGEPVDTKSKTVTIQHATSGRAGDAANVLFFVGCILLSMLFGYIYDPPAPFTKKDLMRSLQATQNNIALDLNQKIALGFNANVDVVVDAEKLLTAAGVLPPAEIVPSDNETSQGNESSPVTVVVSKVKAVVQNIIRKIKKNGAGVYAENLPKAGRVLDSPESLAGTFKRFSSLCQGAERSVSDVALFARLVEACRDPKVNSTSGVGGNAALMATAFAELGWAGDSMLLGGQVGDQILNLLKKRNKKMNSIQVSARATGVAEIESQQVDVSNDEQHIIMEYPEGFRWGGWGPASDHANRFIVSRDASNSAVATMEVLMEKVISPDDKPFRLLVSSGLHLLDGKPDNFVNDRLETYKKLVTKVPQQTLIHLELAAVGRTEVLEAIARDGLTNADSMGLNEQELATLYVVLGGTFSPETIASEDLLTRSIPSFNDVVKALNHVLRVVNEFGSRTLSRIHFHSFAYHVLATKEGSPFINPEAGLAAGSLKASTQACAKSVEQLHGNDLDLKMMGFGPVYASDGSSQVLEISDTNPIGSFKDGDVQFHVVPVLTCRKPVQTVGLGDAISATALGYQIIG